MSWTQARLQGHGVALEPLEPRHLDALRAIADDDVVWKYQPQAAGARQPGWIDSWMETALGNRHEMIFVVRRLGDDRIVGSTRYLAIEPLHRRVEIGGTFYAADARATFVNSACKRLLLGHAFDVFACQRVELKCDERNERSRAAILAIGAKQEGVLRRHMMLRDGFTRDTVYFSILDHEWPDVRARLDVRLRASASASAEKTR